MPTSLRECIRLSIDHSIQNLSESRIVVLHPGYDAPDDFLVALVAADCQNGGLDHETARMLCSIIANNKEGFFSLDRQGFKSVTEDSLAPGRSFFHVARPQPVAHTACQESATSLAQADKPHDGLNGVVEDQLEASSSHEPYRYPVVVDFECWTFPHDALPERWQRYSCSLNRTLDDGCRITNSGMSLQDTNLIPEAQEDWFNRNNMGMYTGWPFYEDEDPMCKPTNQIRLRSDMHQSLDRGEFIIVPKMSEDGEIKMVAHVMISSTELIHRIHNVELHPLPDISRECLYARLARTILRRMYRFLLRDCDGVLVSRDPQSNETRTQSYSASECRKIADALRLRYWPEEKTNDEALVDEEADSDNSEETEAPYQRGRKRRRS